MKFILLIFFNLYFISCDRVERALLFSQYSVLQFTVAIVLPIEEPDRHLALNVGVQCNFMLPFRPSDFEHPMYIAGTRAIGNTITNAVNTIINQFQTNVTKAKRDLSAGEIYNTMQDLMSVQGYHDDCLEKSICELAKTPIHREDDDILMDVIHFLLTPSVHQSFHPNELEQKQIYENAERTGIEGGDCHLMYPNCPESPLHHVTHSIEEYD